MRNLRHFWRQPDLLVFSTIQPIMFVVLFVSVFGGAVGLALPPGVTYVDYLLPGIFVQSVTFRASNTAGRPFRGPAPRQKIVDALKKRKLGLFASSRLVEEARQAREQAKAEKGAVLAKAGILTDEELELAIVPARAKEQAAQQAYDEALAAAEESVELPTTGAAFLALDEHGKRRTARSLIDQVVVSAPVAGGAVADRLSVEWRYGE
jgi:hypothetical protein